MSSSRGRLGDRAGEHAVLDQEVVALVGTARDASTGGLQPDETAARGRDPDRAAAITAVGEREHPGRHRRGRATARAARGPVGVPWVPDRAEAARLRYGKDPELRHARLADDHKARVADSANEEGVVARDEITEDIRAHRVGHPRDGGGVLDGDRNAGERSRIVGADGLRRGHGTLGIDVGEGVDGRLKRLDPLERRGDQLGRADLTRMNQRGQLRRGFEEQLGHRGRRA